ncbi:MAG: hypothetical protein IIU13_00915 [Candidatus Methanomethylophilus sp.]|nr:hypothetical protein [Methanomethylophilus sp.]
MKIYDAYRLAIETGMKHDPRPKEEVDLVLSNAKKAYDALPEEKREFFDTESLWNPYYDCRFAWGEDIAKEADAERLMWGIDITSGELLLADRLREKGQRIDAVVAHHPTGRSRNPFPKVMSMQADIFHDCGVPINVAEGLMGPRMDEVLYNVMGSNYNQAADTARLLGIPFFNIHSAADNMVQEFLEKKVEERCPRRLEDIIDMLMEEPEYKQAARLNDPPRIIVGKKDSRCGGVIAKMTGGTSAPDGIYEELQKAGVGTVVAMHMPNSSVEVCRKCHINVVISGHMASDSLGVNLICDEWERHGIEVFGAAGFTRFSRN